jgi:hypothetical protein
MYISQKISERDTLRQQKIVQSICLPVDTFLSIHYVSSY